MGISVRVIVGVDYRAMGHSKVGKQQLNYFEIFRSWWAKIVCKQVGVSLHEVQNVTVQQDRSGIRDSTTPIMSFHRG